MYKDKKPDDPWLTCIGRIGINMYAELEMGWVSNRVEAFKEIRRFLKANDFKTNVTEVYENGFGMAITLQYDSQLDCFGKKNLPEITLSFIMLYFDRPLIDVTKTGKGYRYPWPAEKYEVVKERVDKYLRYKSEHFAEDI